MTFQTEVTVGSPAPRTAPQIHVGNIESKYFTVGSLVLGMGTIISCYLGSYFMGYVPLWLPMISDTFVYPPWDYVSRLGMITTANLLFVNSLMFYFFLGSESLGGRKAQDSWGMACALIGSICLAILTACNEDENGSIHGTAAVIFFVMELIYMWMSSYRLWCDQNETHVINPTSLQFKFGLSAFVTILLILFGLMSLDWDKWSTEIAMEEWTGVFCILLYNLSYLWEFKDAEWVGSIMITPPVASGSSSTASTSSSSPAPSPSGSSTQPQQLRDLECVYY